MPIEEAGDLDQSFDSDASQDSIDAATRLSASVMNVVRAMELTRLHFAESIGVSPTAVRALGRVAEYGPITPKELASRLTLTTGTITPLLDALEESGLVERTPNPADRRSVLIRLSDKGERSMTWVYGSLHARVMKTSAARNAADSDVIANWLDAYVASLEDFKGLPPAKNA